MAVVDWLKINTEILLLKAKMRGLHAKGGVFAADKRKKKQSTVFAKIQDLKARIEFLENVVPKK